MASPTFTVILTTYNRAALLGRAITSILAQTFSEFELLVIDDASTDQTHEVIRAFADPRLHSIRQASNSGVSVARNVGIEHASGEYIVFVDDDDTIEATFLAEVHAVLAHSPQSVGFLWTWKYIVQTTAGVNRTKLYTYEIHHDKPLPGSDYLGKLRSGSGGLVVRSTAISEIGGFNPQFRTHEDADFLLRLAERFDYIVIPQPLYSIFEHSGERLTERSLERTRTFEHITERYHDTFRRYPQLLSARYHLLGRDYYRFGDRRVGHKYLWKAIQHQPLKLKYWIELPLLESLSYMPTFVQRKVWRKSWRA
jgi:glycosyltransferase involved in cell wall biosynthesis